VPGTFSPDGRWIAYTSNESGRSEVYVAPFPGPGGKWQVSKTGAINAAWRRDGREIFFSGLDGRVMAAPVTAEGARFDVGEARLLFEILQGGPRSFFDVTPDTRFLVNASERSDMSPITLVVNWTSELDAKERR
jgi:eukaryotic-like serine/threonine-protein kinase